MYRGERLISHCNVKVYASSVCQNEVWLLAYYILTLIAVDFHFDLGFEVIG